MRRQDTDWDKIFSKHIWQISVNKNIKKELNNKKIHNLIKIDYLNRHLNQRRCTDGK